MIKRTDYASPEMQSFEVNAEAGFAASPIGVPGFDDGQNW